MTAAKETWIGHFNVAHVVKCEEIAIGFEMRKTVDLLKRNQIK